MFRLRAVHGSSATIATLTEDGEMGPVDGESAFLGQASHQTVDEIVRSVDHTAAIVADHVDVLVI